MIKRVFIKQTLENRLDAGPKAKQDVYKILEKRGFAPIIYVSHPNNRLRRYLEGFIIIFKILKLSGSYILIENPIENWKFVGLANKIMRSRNNHLILLIHDIESERYKHYPARLEYEFINTFDSVIVHNESMKAFLVDKLDKKLKLYTLGIFDYLVDEDFKQSLNKNENAHSRNNKWEVIFCGNLSRVKSSFLYSMASIKPANWNLNLYGTGIEDIGDVSFIKYKNSFSPDRPIVSANSDFGLLWDGDSIDTCSGIWGDYMKLNDPHKLSLYIALNLPIIVWKEAAVAKFVEDNGLGFTIGSLSDIEDRLSLITNEDYKAFIDNLENFNRKVISGEYLPFALKQIDTGL